MVLGPYEHDGTGHNCNTFYDGDICFHSGAGGNCTPMTKEQAIQFALELLVLANSMDDTA